MTFETLKKTRKEILLKMCIVIGVIFFVFFFSFYRGTACISSKYLMLAYQHFGV